MRNLYRLTRKANADGGMKSFLASHALPPRLTRSSPQQPLSSSLSCITGICLETSRDMFRDKFLRRASSCPVVITTIIMGMWKRVFSREAPARTGFFATHPAVAAPWRIGDELAGKVIERTMRDSE